MSEQRPFQVETSIDAPAEVVWRALVTPNLIREWFGWDYEGLDAEIRFIFVDHAEPVPPDLIRMPPDHEIRLIPDGPRTTVRVTFAGGVADADWAELYDGIEEGWRAFFEQLRFLLERRPGTGRRTLYLTGVGSPRQVVAALSAGEPWHDSRFQRHVVDEAGHLVVLEAKAPLAGDEPTAMSVTVSTYGLDDSAFTAVRESWTARWHPLVKDPEITT